MTRVLTVDDDPAILRTLGINLRARGYEVLVASDGRSALQAVREDTPDVVLLDLGLPDVDGVTVLRTVRENSDVPVLVVSARAGSEDKVEALDLGANDYVTKPFDLEELFARLRAATRHLGAAGPVIEVDGLRLDVGDRTASREGQAIHLTPIEWAIVEVLTSRPGRLVRQRELLQSVWGPQYSHETNYLRVHMTAIRKKLEADPKRPSLFRTEPGLGYRYVGGQ
ncbi:response regulator transcription factor [Pseudactinotalea suaedae]|uniref:response regulator transcription factor n=1 Tax=Pseudactinotalea suaedae TaxID=1524924 RepID=UPI0012E29A27|nr:response regulator transcription factor [Pseudactinotalea suaedae]